MKKTTAKVLKQLEIELNTPLKQCSFDEIETLTENGFSLDEKGAVNGLNLYKIKLDTIPGSLTKFQNLKKLRLIAVGLMDYSFLQTFDQLTYLDLTENSLSDLSALQKLTHLSHLYLGDNGLADISPLGKLTRLTSLNLGDNNITDISPLKELIQLAYLDLSNNQISDLAALQELVQLTYLNANNNNIQDITGIQNLCQLTYLTLANNQISDIAALRELNPLTYLSLAYNDVQDVSVLEKLTDLTYLDLSSNRLPVLSALKTLIHLRELNLGSNQISDISFLRGLTRLRALFFFSNLIVDISFLQDLTQLKELSLRSNRITDISYLQNMMGLDTLDLSSNQLTDISPLQRLTALTYLRLDSNQLTDISPLQLLTALRELYLSDNQLTDISPLQGLTCLRELFLGSNQLTDVSPLQGLTCLRELFLDSNQLTDVSPLQGLTALTTLGLASNQLTDISPLQGLTALEYLNLANNPLEIPPIEIAEQGIYAIRNYLRELTESVRLLQCKLLIVGHGEVGKTTLMKKLLNPDFKVTVGQEETTHGIHIEPWHMDVPFQVSSTKTTIEKVQLHFWDFGGQDIYHSTHQFFLTKRSLYLFVWEVRKEDETQSFDYWLNILKLLSDQSPVIIVMNKADMRTKFIDEAGFKAKFPNIQTFHQVSCLTYQGFPALLEDICLNLSHMPHLRDKLPRVWKQIRDRLQREKKKRNYISLADYSAICRKFGLDEERALFLSGYLHDLGVILHYQHDPLLQDTIILKPEWATQAVYTLIDTRAIQENQGSFMFADLEKYWPDKIYPREKHPQLVRLMEKFELCFNFSGTHRYFVPELLAPLKTPPDVSPYQQPGTLRFQYHYEFMPEGIVSRFIARLYYLIDDKHFWKNGVALKFERTTALIIGEPLNRRITIAINGSQQRELLAIIRYHLDYIHGTLNMKNNMHYSERIPCLCSVCRDSQTPFLHKFQALKLAEEKGMQTIPCPDHMEPASISQMLKGLEFPKPKENLINTLITIISQLQGIGGSIQEDEDSRNGFITQLLYSQGYVTKDQTRWGRSATGKSMGEVDIKIENAQGRTMAIIDALKLSNLDRTKINDYIQKVFTYDANGVAHNFLIAYVDTADFGKLWQSYLAYLPQIQYPYDLLGPVHEEKTPFAAIRLARTRFNRDGQETVLYHLFVDMKPKKQ